MKKILFAAALLIAAIAPASAKKEVTHKIITANVRITGLPADDVDGIRWEDRRETCKKVILASKPDIICLQEF